MDGLPVNIPVLSYVRFKLGRDDVWKILGCSEIAAFKCLVRRGRKIRLFVLTRSTNRSASLMYNRIASMYPRKASQIEHRKIVLKPTLVDKSSRLRRLEDTCLRNLANYLGVSYARCPAWDNTRATTKECAATVYHKHRSMLTRKGMYMG